AIDVAAVLDGLHAMEGAAFDRLATTPAEKALIRRSKQLHLAGRLIRFALTPQEWNEYESLRDASSDPALSNFEDSSRGAVARDQAMSRRLLEEMNDRRASTAILVTGGFHTPGIDRLMKDAGVAVLTVTPRLTKLDESEDGAYLQAF